MPIYKGKRCPDGIPIAIEPAIFAQLIEADETVAHTVTLDTKGMRHTSAVAASTTATKFCLDVSNDGVNWVNMYTDSAVKLSEIADVSTFRYVRVHNDPAGSSGTDTVTILISAR